MLRVTRRRRRAVENLLLDPPDRVKWIQYDRMEDDQRVEKMPQAGQRLVLGGGRDGQVAQEPSGQAERDTVELQVLTLTKLEKPPDGPGVGPGGLGVRDPGGEELVRRFRKSGNIYLITQI